MHCCSECSTKKDLKILMYQYFQVLISRGRGDRTPVNGFGDRRTTAVLFPYESAFTDKKYYNTSVVALASIIFDFLFFMWVTFYTLARKQLQVDNRS